MADFELIDELDFVELRFAAGSALRVERFPPIGTLLVHMFVDEGELTVSFVVGSHLVVQLGL